MEVDVGSQRHNTVTGDIAKGCFQEKGRFLGRVYSFFRGSWPGFLCVPGVVLEKGKRPRRRFHFR